MLPGSGAFVLIVACLMWATAALDPICSEVFPSCPFKKGPTIDASACSFGSECPKCLDSPEWIEKLRTLGKGLAKRAFSPHLIYGNWLSIQIVSDIFRIILTEAMDFTVTSVDDTDWTPYSILCCEDPLVSLESWPQTFSQTSDRPAMFSHPLGYEGNSGMYIFPETAKRYPMTTAWNSYLHLPDYKTVFPKAFSTECTDLLQNTLKPCKESNYFCHLNRWTETKCEDGRYVPPQCQGDKAQHCQEAFLATPRWDPGFFESLFKDNNLDFTLAYVGGDLPAYARKQRADGKDIMFYWFEPDPFVVREDLQRINFPPYRIECNSSLDPYYPTTGCDYPAARIMKTIRRDEVLKDDDFKFFFESFQLSPADIRALLRQHTLGGGPDPSYNVSCNWVRNNYDKWQAWVTNTATEDDDEHPLGSPGAFYFVVVGIPCILFIVVAVAMSGVLKSATTKKRDTKHAPQTNPIAVVFTDVESSTNLWSTVPHCMAASLDLHFEIVRKVIRQFGGYEVKTVGDSFMIAVSSPQQAVRLANAIQLGMQTAKWPRGITHAYWTLDTQDHAGEESEPSPALGGVTQPHAPPIAIVDDPDDLIGVETARNFIRHLTRADAGLSPGTSLSTKMQCDGSVRQPLPTPSAHPDVPEFGDVPMVSSMCVGPLNTAALDMDGVSPSSSFQVRAACSTEVHGLRVRIGIHVGDCDVRFDPVSKGFDYYGNNINIAARVESRASGGQTLITEDVHCTLANPLSESGTNEAARGMNINPMGKIMLRGVPLPVMVYEVYPPELESRAELFEPFHDEEDGVQREDSMGQSFFFETSGITGDGSTEGESTVNTDEQMYARLTRLTALKHFESAKRIEAEVQKTAAVLKRMLGPLRARYHADVVQQLMDGWRIPPLQKYDKELAIKIIAMKAYVKPDAAASMHPNRRRDRMVFSGRGSICSHNTSMMSMTSERGNHTVPGRVEGDAVVAFRPIGAEVVTDL